MAKSEFRISRSFDAPRSIVWACFTDPAHMKNWWGPKGFKVAHSKMDLHPGGSYHYCLLSPGGDEMWGRMIYSEIKAPERIVWINSFSDKDGGLARHPGHMTWPLELHSVLDLTEDEGTTTLALTWTPVNPTDEERKTFDGNHASMTGGWTGTLDGLEAYLTSLPQKQRKV